MASKTLNNVNYFLKNGEYIVGNNETQKSGLSPTTYSGAIVIQEKIGEIKITEIGQYAFYYCSITRVTIHAKIRSINLYAFSWCSNLEYINIPETVTFIGDASLYLDTNSVLVCPKTTIEFNQGRKQGLFIDSENFQYKDLLIVIYPSDIVPKYKSSYAFVGTKKYYICTPSVFDFYTKTTTTNQELCGSPQYKGPPKTKNVCTCKRHRRQSNIPLISIIVFLLVVPYEGISIPLPTTTKVAQIAPSNKK